MIRDLDQLLTLDEAREHYEALPGPDTAGRYLMRAQRECERGRIPLLAIRDLRRQLARERVMWPPAALQLLAS